MVWQLEETMPLTEYHHWIALARIDQERDAENDGGGKKVGGDDAG